MPCHNTPETTTFVSSTSRMAGSPLRTGRLNLGQDLGIGERWLRQCGQPVGSREELAHPTAADFLAEHPFHGLRCQQPARLGFPGHVFGNAKVISTLTVNPCLRGIEVSPPATIDGHGSGCQTRKNKGPP